MSDINTNIPMMTTTESAVTLDALSEAHSLLAVVKRVVHCPMGDEIQINASEQQGVGVIIDQVQDTLLKIENDYSRYTPTALAAAQAKPRVPAEQGRCAA